MSGRRSHVRFTVLQPPEAMLRVLQDVIVQNTRHDYTIALSREPGVLGELVSVQFCQDDSDVRAAKVLESQPVIVAGGVRHQLRLRHIGETGGDDDSMAGGIVDQ